MTPRTMIEILAFAGTLAMQGCADPGPIDGGPDCDVPDGSYYVLRGTGAGFDAFENQRMIASTSTSAGEVVCATSVPVVIVGGSFAVEITNPWDGFSAYPRFGAFIDTNANERCDEGEPVWTSVRILINGTVTGQLRGDDAGRCANL